MMKIVVAIDSLKGSLTSIQAGEGTVDALVDGMGGKLVLGFSGAVTKGATACNEAGIDAYFSIVRSAVSLEDAMKKKNAQENLKVPCDIVKRCTKDF